MLYIKRYEICFSNPFAWPGEAETIKYWRDVFTTEHTSSLSGLSCLEFNGRIDTNRSLIDKEGYTQLEFVKEDHYVIVSHPENVYVDHVSSLTSCSSDIAKEWI